jgi:hypothetical protein
MFEPNDSWLEGIPHDPALSRVRESRDLEFWPGISEAEAIGLGWTLLVEDRAAEVLERAPGIPGFRWAAAGLLDPEVDRELELRGQQFGIVFYVDDPQAEMRALDGIEIGGAYLPIALRPISYEEHASVPSLADGTIACWATSAEGTRRGWLTARHVALVGRYPMADCGRECIDAALIDLGIGGGGAPVRATKPSVGAGVEIRGPHPARTTILDVAIELGISASSYFPLRFSTSAVGVSGDSGSLIVADPCGEPVGIYLGAAELDSGQRAGIGLSIQQLERVMKLEAYL